MLNMQLEKMQNNMYKICNEYAIKYAEYVKYQRKRAIDQTFPFKNKNKK